MSVRTTWKGSTVRIKWEREKRQRYSDLSFHTYDENKYEFFTTINTIASIVLVSIFSLNALLALRHLPSRKWPICFFCFTWNSAITVDRTADELEKLSKKEICVRMDCRVSCFILPTLRNITVWYFLSILPHRRRGWCCRHCCCYVLLLLSYVLKNAHYFARIDKPNWWGNIRRRTHKKKLT